MPYNFVTDSFQAKKLQTFFKQSAILYGNRHFCIFEPHLGDLGATYDDYLRLVGKRVGDFILVLI